MSDNPTCGLCSPTLAPLIASDHDWRLILNHNQNLLGKCFWVLQRHEEQVAALTSAEWVALHGHIQHTVAALSAVWMPDHFNIVFLQNQDRHVHLHVIPRYASPRDVLGRTFEDRDYPSHYAVAGPSLGLPDEYRSPLAKPPLENSDLTAISEMLRKAYARVRDRV